MRWYRMQLRWSDNKSSPGAEADLAACRAMLRGGSRSFHAASLLLPRKVYEPAAALYAFCRQADDAIDMDGGCVAALHARLQRVYARVPLPYCADRALATVVATHSIPIALPQALLEGFAWDAEGRRYEDLPALLEYAARVAGSVGAMMAMLMGVRAPDVVARACELGVAMQLSNIARDVGEDARAGRLYLPLQWMREAGIEPEQFIAAPVFSPALGGVVARLLGVAEELYARGGSGVACLPRACRPGIAAARFLYAEIGHELMRRGLDSVGARTVVPGPRKLTLLGCVALELRPRRSPWHIPALSEVQFLVDAVMAAPRPREAPARQKSFDERMAWLVDLFTRLGDREQWES
jgi:15-cis-phytoene synthase